MRIRQIIAVIALTTVLAPALACAADPITVPLSTNAQLPLYNDAATDWSGFYAGVHGGVASNANSTRPSFGAQLGINAQFDFYLLGAEVAVRGIAGSPGPDTAYGQILGRAGLVANDDLLVYSAAGFGLSLSGPQERDALLGGGVELSVNDGLSLRAEYLHGLSATGGDSSDVITFGANFHF